MNAHCSPNSQPRTLRRRPRRLRSASVSVAALAGLVVLILVALVAVNALLAVTVRGVRADLTEGRLYSLSPGVGEFLRGLEEPVRLDFYYTTDAGQTIPGIRTYAARVREFLEEMVAVSGGRIRLNVIDPAPYSEAEDAAKLANVAPLRIDGAGRELLFGLVAVNAVDQSDVIPFLDPQNEALLEYDIVRLIQGVGRVNRPRVGLLSSLPIAGGFDMATRQQAGPWQVHRQLAALFEIVAVTPGDETIPDDIEALVIVHPRDLPDALLRAIDDYAHGGGRILAFLDPHCESDPGRDPTGMDFDRASDLGPLPEAWGVRPVLGVVIGDAERAQRVQAPVSGSMQVLDYLVWLSIGPDALDLEDPMLGSLSTLNLATVGAFEPVEPAPTEGLTIRPLISVGDQTMRIPVERIAFRPDPAALIREFEPSGRTEMIGVRIDGQVARAFPADELNEAEERTRRAPASATIVIFGDADLLRDDMWIVEERIGGMSLGARTIADNGPLVLNAVEMLAGDPALLRLRGRASVTRPFERVERIRSAAEARYLAREQELRTEISQSEQRIADLQVQQGGGQQLVLSPEQEQELKRLEEEVLRARSELRQVQFDLRQDYERLGRRLLLVNVVGWPLMIALIATLWSVQSGVRHRRGGVR